MTTDLRELDRRVAEEVMGRDIEKEEKKAFREYVRDGAGRGLSGHQTWDGDDDGSKRIREKIPEMVWRGNGYRWRPGYRYSSDPAACAMVKRRLRDAGVRFHIYDHAWRGIMVATDDLFASTKYHKTEEEAVCRFALACHAAGLLGGAPE